MVKKFFAGPDCVHSWAEKWSLARKDHKDHLKHLKILLTREHKYLSIQKWQGCVKVVKSLQPCHKLVTQAYHTSSLQPYDHNVKFVTSLSQLCNISPPHHNLVPTLWQGYTCSLMIFILSNTQVAKCLVCSLEKGCYFRFQTIKLEVCKNSMCIGTMKCLVGIVT